MKPSVYSYVVDCDIKLLLPGSQPKNVETCWPKGECCVFLSSLRQEWVLPPPKKPKGREDPREQLRKTGGPSFSDWSSLLRVDLHILQSTVPVRASSLWTGETCEVEKRGQWRNLCPLLVSAVSSEHRPIGFKRAGHWVRRPQQQKAGRVLAEVGSERK